MFLKNKFKLQAKSFLYSTLFVLIFSSDCSRDKSVLLPNYNQDNDFNTADYVLPYPVGKSYQCILGNSEGYHRNNYRYAQNFAMPANSYITAARKGRVVYVKEDVADNDQSDVNYLLVEHYDGSCACYAHLKNNGIFVDGDQGVMQGDTIALSGNTGFTNNTPQLEFYVREKGPFENSATIPVRFKNTIPHSNGVQAGTFYKALPYEKEIIEQRDNSEFPVSTPEQQGINGSKFEEMVVKIDQGVYGNIHCLLIARNDTLVFEKYFQGFHRQELHCLYSVTKSFTSALIGIALNEGKINNLEQKMVSFFPNYNITNNYSLKEKITIKHLLTMTSGLSVEHESQAYFSNNWIRSMLNIPMTSAPGEQFVYHTGNSLLLGGILKDATGQDVDVYAAEKLLGPLGIQNWRWIKGPGNAVASGGWLGGLHLRPLDMLKFGLLFLHKGKWHGETIVPEEWVQESTSRHASFSPNENYSYQWWRVSNNHKIADLVETNDIFYAAGHKGQFIYVIPHLNVVIVSTAWGSEFSEMVADYILPAVTS